MSARRYLLAVSVNLPILELISQYASDKPAIAGLVCLGVPCRVTSASQTL
ncbi:MAG: hypothetical protein KME32_06200 [Mojavia pulchra JT2-VF2]|uniref:Uncharacterized protein n=1 Tax=Mojavia pulchra JT2-VF2 TaxID=287848 RepID=A0A951PX42_9NOST|nr:hypothetical protein [Mojavia pulchra JT2-VF2]